MLSSPVVKDAHVGNCGGFKMAIVGWFNFTGSLVLCALCFCALLWHLATYFRTLSAIANFATTRKYVLRRLCPKKGKYVLRKAIFVQKAGC
jgi:hypothetical protein